MAYLRLCYRGSDNQLSFLFVLGRRKGLGSEKQYLTSNIGATHSSLNHNSPFHSDAIPSHWQRMQNILRLASPRPPRPASRVASPLVSHLFRIALSRFYFASRLARFVLVSPRFCLVSCFLTSCLSRLVATSWSLGQRALGILVFWSLDLLAS